MTAPMEADPHAKQIIIIITSNLPVWGKKQKKHPTHNFTLLKI
jgi:hypothetical protein